MYRNIFIIHGSYGHPLENWFPWLKTQLETLGHNVLVPQFPIPRPNTPGGHKLQEWLNEFTKYIEYVNENTIIVAHSRGCVFCYHLIPTLLQQIDSLFLVGPWMYYHWYRPNWKKVDTFHERPFLWDEIIKKTKHIEIYQSTNDVMPIDEGKEIATNLKAELITVKNAMHFNVSENPIYSSFPLLLENIKKRL